MVYSRDLSKDNQKVLIWGTCCKLDLKIKVHFEINTFEGLPFKMDGK
jgi:hypothetical protein